MKVAWTKIQSCYKQHQTVSQSTPINQQALPLHLMVPVSFSCWRNSRGHCCATWKSQKKWHQRQKKKKKASEGGSQRSGCAAAREHKDSCILYLPPLTNHILFCNTLNQITHLMNKMWFHSKGNILISQIQYPRRYMPILGVNRWSVNSMSIHWVRNSCYWCGWCDWQQKGTDAACISLWFERICRFRKAPSRSKWLAKYRRKTPPPASLGRNINSENLSQAAISDHIRVLFEAAQSPRVTSSHLHTETNICSQQKGLRVLNCHGWIDVAQREHMQRLKSQSESNR